MFDFKLKSEFEDIFWIAFYLIMIKLRSYLSETVFQFKTGFYVQLILL